MNRRNMRTKSLVNPVKHTMQKLMINPVYDNFALENDDCSRMNDMFIKLSNYIDSIKILFYEYSLGNISIVESILTRQTYETISVEFTKLSVNEEKYPKYEKLRKNYVYAISGLYQSLLQNLNLTELSNRLNSAIDRASILDDPEKLKEYINKFKSYIFPDTSIKIISVKIKPEYLEYINLYGYPSSNIFEPDKLGEIILRLKNTDIMNDNYFFCKK
jgi:hypothetical protein